MPPRPGSAESDRGCESRLLLWVLHTRCGGMLRHVLPDLLAGSVAGLVAAGGIIATNLGSLRDLMLQSQDGWLAGLMLGLGFVTLFGAAAVGRAISQIDTRSQP